MALNQTPASERVHIAFFGRRNAGKSSVMNAVTGQNLAVVSEVKGTTTDPVFKTMELLPLGPVMVIDTPGMDDAGELGELRVQKSFQVLNQADIAVLVADGTEEMQEADRELLRMVRRKNLPYLVVFNKADLMDTAAKEKRRAELDGFLSGMEEEKNPQPEENSLMIVSAKNGEGIYELKERLGSLRPRAEEKSLLEGLVRAGDTVVLVIPLDKAAPKGRLILPEQMAIRALLDEGCTAVVTRETELVATLGKLKENPQLVITDSQAFAFVSEHVPPEIPLTSFSILMARYKGDLGQTVEGVRALMELKDGDLVLISEGCTHHRQCGDIGTVKLPKWISDYTGRKLEFAWSSGTEFPKDLRRYKLIVHCGGCMLNEREMKYRLACAREQNVPMTNYGILIACVNGILDRSIALL